MDAAAAGVDVRVLPAVQRGQQAQTLADTDSGTCAAGNGQEARIRGELALLAQEYPLSVWPAVRDRVEAELFAPAPDVDETDADAEAAA